MDFDHAAQRLAKDHSKLKGRAAQNKKRVEHGVSARAKREALLRRKQQEQLAAERKKRQQQEEHWRRYVRKCDRTLGLRQLLSSGSRSNSNGDGSSNHLALRATSIHGEGDKISLPPSILEVLTANLANNDNQSAGVTGSPWTFRIGILNPDYKFPSSPLIMGLKPPNDSTVEGDEDDDDDSDMDDDGNSEVGEEEAYLDELRHKYLAYTHGTVVEFTQEEGHVGLPERVAAALLDPPEGDNVTGRIPSTLTVDPAGKSVNRQGDDEDGDDAMDVDGDDDEKTPGHLAWGAFPVPDMPVEVSLVRLPKGRACRLVPTPEAIENGFYNLKNVKLVLEQSLIRTRATLSVGDLVRTWHRGKKYDLKVASVTPSTFHSVTCINTDIEVEFGEPEEGAKKSPPSSSDLTNPETTDARNGTSLEGGHVLAGAQPVAAVDSSRGRRLDSSSAPQNQQEPKERIPAPGVGELLPEPPSDQAEGVCTVMIRADGANGRRRFDVRRATTKDLFDFAATVVRNGVESSSSSIRLVTRYPRRVFTSDGAASTTTMAEAGIQPGQELFMVERL